MCLQVPAFQVFTDSHNPGKVQSGGGHTDPLSTLDNPAKSRTEELKCVTCVTLAIGGAIHLV
jgi:hypothetical protein